MVCKAFGLPLPDTFPIMDADGASISSDRYVAVAGGDVVNVGELRFEVIETPGHTKGGVCFYERSEKTLFCGDTLFAGAIGRTDHPGGDYDTLMRSIFEKLLHLDGETAVIPGHGPSTDIATERMTNPFLMPFNEPYDE
jgi:glyoxylase-like metal-dependent hydrolase (beta-lactamase superfamily II)